MATPIPYFIYPFAEAGDTSAITLTGIDTDPINYQAGYGTRYELDLNTDSSALPINRYTMNQLFLDITSAIQQQQLQGFPAWVSVGSNGPPTGYPLYANVFYAGQIWTSNIASNTSTPGADNNWSAIGGRYQRSGTIFDFAGPIAPAGSLECDGTAISRTTYSNLLAAVTTTQSVVMTISTATFTTSNLTGLYIGMFVESSNLPSSTTILNIVGTTVTLSNTAAASGTFPVTFFQWGNGDGSDTFNLPNLRGRTTFGANGFDDYQIGNDVGQTGGLRQYKQLPSDVGIHTHGQPTTSPQHGRLYL